MKKLFYVAILLLFLPFQAFSQFVVNGKVIDKETGESLAGAHISVENTFKSTISNGAGAFIIKTSKVENFTIQVTYVGYRNYVDVLKVSQNLDLIIALEKNTVMSDEVIITATRADERTPATYVNIGKQTIEKMNLGQDIPFLLDLTPSVVSTSDAGAGVGYTGLRIRGSDITRINVTVNGIPLNDSESHGVWWVNMPDISSSLNNIQIQRGVGTSTNGAGAFGANINLQTAEFNQNPYGVINTSYGSFNTIKNTVMAGTGLIDQKWSFDTRLSKLHSDGYVDRATSDLKSFYVSGGYQAKKSMVKMIVFSGKEKTYQAWYGIPKASVDTNRTFNPNTYENETDNYQQDHYQLHFSHQINPILTINSALHLTHGEGYYEQFKENRKFSNYLLNNVIIGSDTIKKTNLIQQKWLENNFYGLTFSLNYGIKSKLSGILGGAFNKYDGNHFGKVIWAKYASNGSINHEWYRNLGTKTDANVFVKSGYQITDEINVYGDVQLRQISYKIDGTDDDLSKIDMTRKYVFINPKAGLFYLINENQKFYVSFAISNREPNRANYIDADSGKIPAFETLKDYEIGYTFSKSNVRFDLNGFYMDYKNQLVLTGEINDVGDAIQVNVPKSYRLGVETSSSYKITKKWSWIINFSLSQNKIKEFNEYVDEYNSNWEWTGQKKTYINKSDISFSPAFTGNNIFSYEPLKNMELSLISKYVSRQYIDNSSNHEKSLDPWFVNNLRFSYTFNLSFIKSVGIYLMLNNILDEKYESNAWVYSYLVDGMPNADFGFFPQAGINFIGGLSLKF